MTAVGLLAYWFDICRMQSLWAFDGIERHGLTGFQCLVSIHSNGGIVCEKVVSAVIRKDESEAFCIIEPLHLPGTHGNTPVLRVVVIVIRPSCILPRKS